jgi:DNA-directed RNA polymerase sigma subunit (sigma70/sigma32)
MSMDKEDGSNLDELLQQLGVEERQLESTLSLMTPKEERLIREKYGIPVPKEGSTDEAFNATRERIRRIEAKALKRLREKRENDG